MHSYYSPEKYNAGEIVVARKGNGIDSPTNPTGQGIWVFSDCLNVIGCVMPNTQLLVLCHPEGEARASGPRTSLMLRVLAPEFGDVWVQTGNVRRP